MKKVAIFDVDGTIFRSSLLIELTERLIEKELFPLAAQTEYQDEYRKWLNRQGSYEEYIEAVISVFMKYLRGVAYKDFLEAGDEIFEQQKIECTVIPEIYCKNVKAKIIFYWLSLSLQKGS